MIVILTTTPNINEAESLAKKIVEAKLAACVQILPQIKSIYFWNGEIQNDSEHLLLIKTLNEKFAKVNDFILENHSYEVPEIVALEAKDVSESYLKWLTDFVE